MPGAAEQRGKECKHGLGAGTRPAHASLFHALLNQGFGRRFDRIAADGEAGLPLGGVVCTPSVFPQVGDSLLYGWRQR